MFLVIRMSRISVETDGLYALVVEKSGPKMIQDFT
jgi:hypothetical protein